MHETLLLLQIMYKLSLIMNVTDTIFIDYVRITLTKLRVEFQANPSS